jgi:hypothetical protein
VKSSLAMALGRALRQPAFVTVALVLLVAAVSLNASIEYLQLHFKKERVELRRKLIEVPLRLGPWVQVTTDTAVNHEIEEVLGTKDYIYRFYVDSRRVAPETIAAFRDKPSDKQREMVMQVQAVDPHAVIHTAVTYYTGMVDTVAHIPDRCYVADGYEPSSYDVARWDALRHRPGDGSVRYINFEDQTPARKSVTKNVAYFFNSNGEYMNDPLGVREKLQDLFETHGYYAKVELLMVTPDRDRAAHQMNDFLVSALPEFEKCLPDWNEIQASKKNKKN